MGAITSFFGVRAGEYENLAFSAADASTATVLIWGICAVIILASLYAFYVQKVPGRVARSLLCQGAKDAESAKTAAELGIAPRSLATWELTHGTALRRIVHEVQENGNEPRYFIPEELRYRAEVRYDKKGNELVGLLITVVLSIGLAVLLVNLLPIVLTLVDGTMK